MREHAVAQARNKWRAWLTKPSTISLLVGTGGLIAALIFGLLSLTPDEWELTVVLQSSEELTLRPSIAGLEGTFRYRGEDVAYLWRARIALANTGNRTLVGVGANASVLFERLRFEVVDEARILSVEIEANDPGVTAIVGASHFDLTFEQWRQGEEVLLSCLIASDTALAWAPSLEPVPRQIVDGRIRALESSTRDGGVRQTYLPAVPRWVSAMVRLLGIVAVGAIMLLLGVLTVNAIWTNMRWKLVGSKRENALRDFQIRLESYPELDHEIKGRLLEIADVYPPSLIKEEIRETLDRYLWHAYAGELQGGRERAKAVVGELHQLIADLPPEISPPLLISSLATALVALAMMAAVVGLGFALVDLLPL